MNKKLSLLLVALLGLAGFAQATTNQPRGEAQTAKPIMTSVMNTLGNEEVDVSLDAEPGDLTAAIKAASGGLTINNLEIKLKSAGDYTVSETIVANTNVNITGVEGAVIDAFALQTPLITPPAGDLNEWKECTFKLKNVSVKGLKNALFYSNAKKRAYTEFTLDSVVVEQAGDAVTLDFTKGSAAKVLTIQNSTIYAPIATTKSFYSSQSGQKITEYNANAKQTFIIKNSTMYNLAMSKNFFTHRQFNQNWLVYNVENSIFVNCGKKGETIKGINGGANNTGNVNPTWNINGNAFNFTDNGVMTDTSANESTGDDSEGEGVQNSVAGIVVFADADNGDFTLGDCAANTAKIGDPRGIPTYSVKLADGTEDAENWTITPNEGLEGGENINIQYDGTKRIIDVKAVKKP